MSGRLAGKVAFVAGAGSIAEGWSNGKATSVLFAREGATVFAVDSDLGRARDTVEAIRAESGDAQAHAAAVSVEGDVAAANAQHGVRVNAILPGLMNTPMAIEARVAQGRSREEVIAARDARIPLGRRMGTGWDVAHAALFLHSDKAAFITGTVLVVGGGELVADGL